VQEPATAPATVAAPEPPRALTAAERRAQRKAQMAAPGERMGGATAGVEAELPSAKGATVIDQEGRRVGVEHEGELTRTDATEGTPAKPASIANETRDAAEAAARNVLQPLKKGDLPRVMDKVMREIDDMLALHSDDPAGAQEALRAWSRKD